MAKTQTQRRTETLEKLHLATVKVIVNKGFSRLTTGDIVREAGLSQGALFRYYPTKLAAVVGATYYTKRIPKEKLVEFCKKETRPIFLLGGKEDAETAQSVADICGNAINLCGKLSLHGSAYCVQQASVVITSDTGLMHIAAAFRKPIVSIWGNTVPKFGMYPFYPEGMDLNTTIEVAGLRCRPCSKIGYDRCPKGHFKCMKEIRTEQVVAALHLY